MIYLVVSVRYMKFFKADGFRPAALQAYFLQILSVRFLKLIELILLIGSAEELELIRLELLSLQLFQMLKQFDIVVRIVQQLLQLILHRVLKQNLVVVLDAHLAADPVVGPVFFKITGESEALQLVINVPFKLKLILWYAAEIQFVDQSYVSIVEDILINKMIIWPLTKPDLVPDLQWEFANLPKQVRLQNVLDAHRYLQVKLLFVFI